MVGYAIENPLHYVNRILYYLEQTPRCLLEAVLGSGVGVAP